MTFKCSILAYKYLVLSKFTHFSSNYRNFRYFLLLCTKEAVWIYVWEINFVIDRAVMSTGLVWSIIKYSPKIVVLVGLEKWVMLFLLHCRSNCFDTWILQAHKLYIQDHFCGYWRRDIPGTEAKKFCFATSWSKPDRYLCFPCTKSWPVLFYHFCPTFDRGTGCQEHLHCLLWVQGAY